MSEGPVRAALLVADSVVIDERCRPGAVGLLLTPDLRAGFGTRTASALPYDGIGRRELHGAGPGLPGSLVTGPSAPAGTGSIGEVELVLGDQGARPRSA